MRKSILLGSGLAACVLALAPVAFAQGGYTPPKTSWGAPDLQGYWTNSSITKMTRPGGIDTLVITPEQAKKLEDGDARAGRVEHQRAAEVEALVQSEHAEAWGRYREDGEILPLVIAIESAALRKNGIEVRRYRGQK